MKKNATALSGITLICLTATACGGGDVDTAWFDDNCPTEVSDVHESVDQGQPSGDVIGQAVSQGPIHPPSDLESSEYQSIGLYTYDELSGAMELEREVTSEDAFCLEPDIGSSERSETVDTREAEVEGDLHGDVYEVDFTMLHSPEYPEGIWVGLHRSDLPDAIEITDDMPEECALEWWAATEEIDVDAVGDGEPIAGHALTRADDC